VTDESPTPAPKPRSSQKRRRRNQRIRIVIELLIGGAAIWFVMHPSAFPMLPQPDWAEDSLVDDSLASAAAGVPALPRSAGAERTLASGTVIPKGRLFRSIEERARAGERIAVSMTAYCLQGRTRRGNLVRDGIIAVDRKLFPLGREVDLFFGRKKYGRFLADDTGGVIKGGIIDVWIGDCTAARRFGRRRGYAQLVPRDQ
jgi:3D (Asp-Asp-Asp) domain-containing protein